MRIGLIARGDYTGLSVQTHAFYRHLNPDKTLVVDLSRHSGKRPNMSLYPDGSRWDDATYPELRLWEDPKIDRFLDDLDVVFTCETPYNYWLFQRARERGVKTVLQFNYEFLDYSRNSLPEPDLFAAPSTWHLEDVRKQLPGREIIHLPVPVDRKRFPYHKRTSLKTLLHTAGTVAMEDRNGSTITALAMGYVKSDVKLRLRSQFPVKGVRRSPKIEYLVNKVEDPSTLYANEDVFVFPRKFGGLCLPLNEAVSCGMPVIVSDCDPQTAWVPEELRVKAKQGKKVETRNTLRLWECEPKDVATKIDWLAQNPKKVEEYSEWADEWAQSISWEVMLPEYQRVLESL